MDKITPGGSDGFLLDTRLLQQAAIPFAHEILTFFDRHYRTDERGRLVMHPAQAVETWWDCTNPMPELAGCIAVTQRLLTLPAEAVPTPERQLWKRLHGKLAPLPLRDVEGAKALADRGRGHIPRRQAAIAQSHAGSPPRRCGRPEQVLRDGAYGGVCDWCRPAFRYDLENPAAGRSSRSTFSAMSR